MNRAPCAVVYTLDDQFPVQLRHYDQIKAALKQAGPEDWLELDSLNGDGKILVSTGAITAVLKATRGYCAALDDLDKAVEAEEADRDMFGPGRGG